MADKQKTIDIIFGGIDNTGSAFKSVGSNLNSLERNVGSITAPLASVADSILKLDAVIAAAAVGLTGYGIKLADDFGTSFAEIATLIGQPADSLGEFKDQIQQYAEGSTASFEEITSATYNAISAGVDYEKSLEVIATAEKLSIAGRADLGITTKALVSTMNAFGAEMSEAADYSDVFFTTVQKGQTTLPELAESVGNVAPLAAQAGISFDELGAAIAAITAGAGVSTAEAMTALQATISNIINPSEKAAKAAADLGLDFNLAALESKGLAGFLSEVEEKAGGNTQAITDLFGSVRSYKAVLPLAGNASDDFARNLEAMENRSGAASKAAKELETDLSRLGQTLKNNVTSAFISFGDNLTDESAEIINSLSNIFNSIGDEIALDDGAFAPLIGQLEGVFQDIQAKFETIAGNLPEALKGLDFTDVVRAFDDLGDELGEVFRAMFGDVDLDSVEGLEAALQTVVDAFAALVDLSSGIISGLEPLFALIGEGVEQFKDMDAATLKTAGEWLGLAKTINTLLPLIGGLADGLNAVGNGMIALAGVESLKLVATLGDLGKIAGSFGKFGIMGKALFGVAGVGAVVAAVEYFSDGAISDLFTDTMSEAEVNANWEATNRAAQEAIARAKELKEAQQGVGEAFEQSAEFKELDIEYMQLLADISVDAAKAQGDMSNVLVDVAEAGNKSVGALETVKIKTGEAAEAAKKAAKETKEYQLKLLEIASDERIANIEANVELNIAQLEADTKQAVSIIETLGEAIGSTGDLMGELFGLAQDATGSKRFAVERQIKREEERRQKAFEQQQELTDAQIDLAQKKAEALRKGDAVIKVNAEGLTPALEMIFNEVLEFAQVRANQEGLELLTGL